MQKTLVVLALVAVLGLVMTEAVDLILTMQQAEATRGCPLGSPAPNASKGRCIR